MATYEFACTHDKTHPITEHICRISERPDALACGTCGAAAVQVISRTLNVSREGWRSAEERGVDVRVLGEGCGVRCPDIVCTVCEHLYFEALLPGETTPTCPKCGAGGRELPGTLNAEQMKRYPYWDRGLGCWVKSPAHRASIMRARGLLEYSDDNDNALERFWGEEDRKRSESERKWRDYLDRLDHHPGFRDLRRREDIEKEERARKGERW